MNERINELFGRALDQAVPETWTTLNPAQLSKLKDKFAELIIRECLGDFKDRITRRYQGSDKDRDIGYGMEIVYYEIVDRFGVE